jgi:aspartyl/asparaginyl beta-hydroxylase (cupin superfamily)
MAVIVGSLSLRALFKRMSQDRRSIQWLQLNLQLKFDRTRNEFMNLTHLHAFPNAIQRKDLKVMLTWVMT